MVSSATCSRSCRSSRASCKVLGSATLTVALSMIGGLFADPFEILPELESKR